MKTLPARLYICPECQYAQPYRWVLAQHLRNKHGYRKRESVQIAAENEFWANPHYIRVKEEEE